jgi:hypothetical protein
MLLLLTLPSLQNVALGENGEKDGNCLKYEIPFW